ncbi:MAG: PAS domain-containing protein [Candidatus Omnitrophica bacterium]|nr:PAS domain-containing protein [Candidatus Omnitrophota bacterium]
MKEELFYKIIDSLYEGVYIIDTDRKILYWNKAAQDITGYHAEEVAEKVAGTIS